MVQKSVVFSNSFYNCKEINNNPSWYRDRVSETGVIGYKPSHRFPLSMIRWSQRLVEQP